VLDVPALEAALGIPVVTTVATGGQGMADLGRAIAAARAPHKLLHYDQDTEATLATLTARIESTARHPRFDARGLAVLHLGHDPEATHWLEAQTGQSGQPGATLAAIRGELEQRRGGKLAESLARERGEAAGVLAARCLQRSARATPLLAQRIGQWVVHPVWSLPILLAALYAVYQFVGVFGASVLVGLLEKDLFEGVLNPAVTQWVEGIMPWPWLAALLVGEYGLWTMGMTYALALILPIVTTFFLAFGVLEDSGYLPRLSVIANRMFAPSGSTAAPCCRWCWGWAASPWPR
jgi:ferrous iron transport protein B